MFNHPLIKPQQHKQNIISLGQELLADLCREIIFASDLSSPPAIRQRALTYELSASSTKIAPEANASIAITTPEEDKKRALAKVIKEHAAQLLKRCSRLVGCSAIESEFTILIKYFDPENIACFLGGEEMYDKIMATKTSFLQQANQQYQTMHYSNFAELHAALDPVNASDKTLIPKPHPLRDFSFSPIPPIPEYTSYFAKNNVTNLESTESLQDRSAMQQVEEQVEKKLIL